MVSETATIKDIRTSDHAEASELLDSVYEGARAIAATLLTDVKMHCYKAIRSAGLPSIAEKHRGQRLRSTGRAGQLQRRHSPARIADQESGQARASFGPCNKLARTREVEHAVIERLNMSEDRPTLAPSPDTSLKLPTSRHQTRHVGTVFPDQEA